MTYAIISNKKLLATTFMDYAINAKTEVIDVAEDNKELINAAKNFNLAIPSPDFAVLKTIYAEVDVPNRNGAILPKEAAIKGLHTLIGKQCNWNHEGANQICGYIIDAKLEDNFIVVYAVIFKSLFPEEMAQLKDEFARKDLAVSFEIWSRNPETGDTVVTEDKDGNRVINPIIFHGMGVLINEEPPACPNAYASKLYAMFKVDKKEESDNLVFASLLNKKECFQCAKCTSEKGEKMADDIVKIGNPGVNMPEVDQTQFENDYAWAPCEDAKKMTKEQRDALKDEDFAKVMEFKNQDSGEPKKVRILPIHDETHVAVSYSAIKNDGLKELMSKYGCDCMEAEKKIMDKAVELKMALCEKGTEEVIKEEQISENSQEAAQVVEPVQETTVVPDVKPEEAKATPEETSTPAEVTPEVANIPEVAPADVSVKVDRIITEETRTEVCTYGETGQVEEEKTTRKVTTIFSNGTQEVIETEVIEVEKFSREQLMAAVDKAVAEKVSEKETEIQTLKAELETVKASKESEISSLQQEVTDKDIEIAKVEQESEVSLEIGSAEITPLNREDIVEEAARKVEKLADERNKKLLKKK